jgi:hypothetical protein
MSGEKLPVFAIVATQAKRRYTFRSQSNMRVMAGTAVVCCHFMWVLKAKAYFHFLMTREAQLWRLPDQG